MTENNKNQVQQVILVNEQITKLFDKLSKDENVELSKYENNLINYSLIPYTVGITTKVVLLNNHNIKMYLVYETDGRGIPFGISPLTPDLTYAIKDAYNYIKYKNSKNKHKKKLIK